MFHIICLLMIKGVETNNLAFGKPVRICSSKVASVAVTDGDRRKLAEIIVDICPEETVTVDLGDYYFVHSVVVYGGEKLENDQILFGATIGVSMVNGDLIECGKQLKRNDTAFHGIRVNCGSTDYAVSLIKVSIATVPFYLAEVEVLSLARGLPYKTPMIHLGCFSRLSFLVSTSAINFDGCRSFCSSSDYLLAALKDRRCFCAQMFDHNSEEPPQYCNTTCASSNENCGSISLHSVYLVQVQLPYLKGCSTEEGPPFKVKGHNNMDVARCLQLCDQSHFALIKNGIYCVCSNESSENSFGSAESCNTPCSGNPNNHCGGTNLWSVYGTCFKVNPPTLPCSKLFHCARSWDEYGVCQGGCKDGYIGEHCIEREKSPDPNMCRYFDPCKNQSNTVCQYITRTNTFQCHCKDGFWQGYVECEDIDECMFEVCDNRSSVCENLFGSFECECNTGFFHLIKDICTRNSTAEYYPRKLDLEILVIFSTLSLALFALLLW